MGNQSPCHSQGKDMKLSLIDQKTCDALVGRQSFRDGNTKVVSYTHNTYREVVLHGYIIFQGDSETFCIYPNGYFTATTKRRLNACLLAYNAGKIIQKDFKWFDVYYDYFDTLKEAKKWYKDALNA